MNNEQEFLDAIDRRDFARRGSDEWRYWLPLILSIATTLIVLGAIWGSLGGRLLLIEYRLGKIEEHVNVNPGR